MPKRMLWMALGLAATGCGIAGAVLPILPTTPFLLLAALAFARSSPRLHAWLVDHPRLGPPIDNWRRQGAIGRRAKAASIVVMAATLALSIALGLNGYVILIQALCLVGAGTFILTRPDAAEGSAGRQSAP